MNRRENKATGETRDKKRNEELLGYKKTRIEVKVEQGSVKGGGWFSARTTLVSFYGS